MQTNEHSNRTQMGMCPKKGDFEHWGFSFWPATPKKARLDQTVQPIGGSLQCNPCARDTTMHQDSGRVGGEPGTS